MPRAAAAPVSTVSVAHHQAVLLRRDLSYRHTRAIQEIARRRAAGETGRVFAASLVFHDAYGPDKPWFYNPDLSGGGCVINRGVHLVDLVLWLQGFQPLTV